MNTSWAKGFRSDCALLRVENVSVGAAIGSFGRQELEMLMARGLNEEDAVDIIIRGMLRG